MENTSFLDSPFKFKPCHIACENKVVTNTAAEINRLRSSGALLPIDLEIMKIISQYRYLNKFNISCLVKDDSTILNSTKDANVKTRIGKMVKNGLLMRHHFAWTDGFLPDRDTCFYMLSRGAAAYIKKTGISDFTIDEVLTLESPERVMLQLAFNQAMIQLSTKAVNVERRMNLVVKAPNLKEKFSIYGYITSTGAEDSLSVILEPVRKFPTWESYVTKRAALFSDYLAITKGTGKGPFKTPPLFVLVCEDDTHIQECYDVLKSCDLGPVYTTDTRLMDADLNGSFIGCKDDGSGSLLIRYKAPFELKSCQVEPSAL